MLQTNLTSFCILSLIFYFGGRGLNQGVYCTVHFISYSKCEITEMFVISSAKSTILSVHWKEGEQYIFEITEHCVHIRNRFHLV